MSTKFPSENLTEEQQNQLEESLKDLLEKILTYMEKFIKTKEDLHEIETKLNDYDNLNALLQIIKTIFLHLTSKIDETLSKSEKNLGKIRLNSENSGNSGSTNKDSNSNEEYNELEKILQKHEAEIRIHIRSNQTMKLFQESLQQKYEESEQSRTELLEGTKLMMNELKKQNNQLSESIKQQESENRSMKDTIKVLNENLKIQEERLMHVPFLEEKIQTLEKMVKENMNDKYLMASTQMMSNNNSSKKMSQDIDLRSKQRKTETSSVISSLIMGQGQSGGTALNTSPVKLERRVPTPNLLNSVVKESSTKSGYQRFYNNFKLSKDENKDIKLATTYSNNPVHSKSGINQLIQSTLREKESAKTLNSQGNSQGNSITNSHNNSFACNNSSSSKNFKQGQAGINHKRSKSHQMTKIRGVIINSNSNNNMIDNNNNNIFHLKNATDQSRLSSQDISDFQINQYHNNK